MPKIEQPKKQPKYQPGKFLSRVLKHFNNNFSKDEEHHLKSFQQSQFLDKDKNDRKRQMRSNSPPRPSKTATPYISRGERKQYRNSRSKSPPTDRKLLKLRSSSPN